MNNLIVLCGENCGYCKKAKMLIKRVLEKDPRLLAVNIRYVMDSSDEGRQLAHTLVPAFYIDGVLAFEGKPDIETVTSILTRCYSSR